MSDKRVRIKWTCPCGHENRWKHDREETDWSPPMSALECESCGKESRARIKTYVYEVVP